MAPPKVAELVRDLDLDGRLRLVQDLWDAIADDVEQRPLTEAERSMLDARIAEHEENPNAAVPWSEVRARLLARR